MNELHHDADDFWGRQGDWRPSRSTPRTTSRTGRGTGLAGRLRSGVSSVFDAGADATREHRRVDATAPRRPADPADQVDPTPVLPQRDLLDGWPDDDEAPGGGDQRRRARPAAPPPAVPFDEDDLSYGHDDRAYAGLGDLADDEPHPGAVAPAPGAAAAAAAGRRAGARRRHGSGGPGGETHAAADETRWGAGWEPVDRGGGVPSGVDPRLARFGVVAVVVTLLVPVVLGLRSDDGAGEIATEQNPSTTAAPETTASTAPAVTVVVADGTASPDRAPGRSRAGSGGSDTGSADDGAADDVDSGTADAGSGSADAEASAGVAASAASCAQEYEVVSGDYWLRLADGAGVALADLLAVNGATADTPIYPGGTICLPAGASTPPPPPAPTTAAVTAASASPSSGSGSSSSSATTAAPTTAAPTTAAPATPAPTEPPATQPAPTQPPATDPPATDPPATDPPTAVGPAAVRQLIRDIWPDDLEERALQIADRESNFVPTAKNFCCYGVFQIYWEVHKGWLADMGVTSDQQLFDAETNIRAALELYRRSGGWGPWGF